MEGRKWEDMSTDCLVNIFGRLDIESRLLKIPAVCKPWYRAVQNPLCWQKLDFLDFSYCSKRTELMRIVVDLSQRCVTSLVLWNFSNTDDLVYLSEACPALKTLELHTMFYSDGIVPRFEGKWKNLEFISIDYADCIVELIELVFIHLTSLTRLRVESLHISDHVASTLVSLLPKLKHLTINHATLEKKNLLLILQGCRELVFLDVRNCIGFDEDDEEILKLSSFIKSFHCDGSEAQDPFSDDYDYDYDYPDDFDPYRRSL